MKKLNLLSKLNDIPISKKFMVVYIICVLIPMILVYATFYEKIIGEVNKKDFIATEHAISRVSERINTIINGSKAISNDMLVDVELNELLDKEYETTADYYQTYFNRLRDKVDRYVSGYNGVIRVSVYTDNPTVIRGGNFYPMDDKMKESGWYEQFIPNVTTEQLIGWQEENPLIVGDFTPRISMFRVMNSYRSFNVYQKILRIDVEEGQLIYHLRSEVGIQFDLANEQGTVFVSSRDLREEVPKKTKVIYQNIDSGRGNHWTLIAYVPINTFTNEIAGYGVLVIVLFVISFLFSLMMIFLFTHSYHTRIRILQTHMKKVENSEFELIEEAMGKDEIGYLGDSFNKMTTQINELINEVLAFTLREKEYQLENVKAELRFLQSQMDPHFLFNTLNAIMVVANQKGYTEIVGIIKSLSKTLRYLIDWKDGLVDIYEEVQFTQMYLEIEKFRFRDKFEFSLEIEEGLKNITIPKMTIQPFVENACKHGLQASKNIGRVWIRVYSMRNQVHIIVRDNGVGMDKDKVHQIIHEEVPGHIGVQNVIQRLKLHYQDGHEFTIQSSKGEGTTVHIIIPKEEEEIE